MFKFKREQKILDVAGVKLGGQPGELPTVLIGSIFYQDQSIVLDKEKGLFDKGKCEALINRLEVLSDLTTNPFMLDIYGTTKEAFIKYIDYVADVTNAPFLIDAFDPMLRAFAVQHVAKVGLADKTVYNSIYKGAEDTELETINSSGIKASVLLMYNSQDETANGRLKTLRDLLPLSAKAGIEKPLLDTAMPAFGISMGAAERAIYLAKEMCGDRCAVGTHTANAVDTCSWVKNTLKEEVQRACEASQNAIAPLLGADWIMFGPIEFADYIFPTIALIDSHILTATAELGIEPAVDGIHPIFKLIT